MDEPWRNLPPVKNGNQDTLFSDNSQDPESSLNLPMDFHERQSLGHMIKLLSTSDLKGIVEIMKDHKE